MKQVLFLIGFLLIAVSCWATTYNIGPGETYETFAAFHVAITVSPGDIIDGGDNTFTERVRSNGGGNATSRITYQNFSIEGNNVTTAGIYNNSTTNEDYHTYSNISINGTTSDGINIYPGCDNIILENITVSNIRDRYGILVQGNNVIVRDSNVSSTYNDGLVLICSGSVEVDNVHTWDTDTSDSSLGDGLTVQNSDNTSQVHIYNCEFEQWTDGKQGIIIEVNGTVEINDCLFWGKAGDEAGVKLAKCGDTTIRHCLFHDLDPAITAVDSTGSIGTMFIYGNVLYNISDVAFSIWDGIAFVYNNTVFSCAKGLRAHDDATVTFKNNIIYGKTNYLALEIYNSASYTGDYNCFYPASSTDLVSYKSSHYTTLAAYQAAVAQDQSSIGEDPLYTDSANDDFTLDPDSPCINAGVVINEDDEGLSEDCVFPTDVRTIKQSIFKKPEMGAFVWPYGAGNKIW